MAAATRKPPVPALAAHSPGGGPRGPHRGEHLVEGEPLHPVAAAQARDLQLRGAVGDLKGEEVLPLRPRGMQPRDAAPAGTEGEEGVVLDVALPEVRPALGEDEIDVAGDV